MERILKNLLGHEERDDWPHISFQDKRYAYDRLNNKMYTVKQTILGRVKYYPISADSVPEAARNALTYKSPATKEGAVTKEPVQGTVTV